MNYMIMALAGTVILYLWVINSKLREENAHLRHLTTINGELREQIDQLKHELADSRGQ